MKQRRWKIQTLQKTSNTVRSTDTIISKSGRWISRFEYLKDHALSELAEYFQTHHIKPLALNALVFFNNRDEKGHREIIEEFKGMMETCKMLGVKYVVAVPLVTEQKILKEDIKASSVEVLTELSDIAEPYGVKIAVEFVGHPECTVNTFSQAYDIVMTVNRDNVGLVFDSFHFHAMGSSLEDLKRRTARKSSFIISMTRKTFQSDF